MVAWSVEAFRRAPGVAAAVIAAPPGHEEELSRAAGSAVGIERAAELHLSVVAGGASRAESVGLALAEAGPAELVVVHDAARPLVSAELIESLIRRLASASEAAGVIAAAPIAETVKRVGAGRVIEATVDRRDLWTAQTPQVFRCEALLAAHEAAAESLAEATDDAMLVERAGGRVLVEPVGTGNLKITTPADLELAERLLASR